MVTKLDKTKTFTCSTTSTALVKNIRDAMPTCDLFPVANLLVNPKYNFTQS